jgi:dUTP pyrophosphatase
MFGKIPLEYNQANGNFGEPIRQKEEIKDVIFTNKSTNPDPEYKYNGDSGFDLRAWICEENETDVHYYTSNTAYIILKPFERRLIHTGLYVLLPEYTELQVRTRSGCALKGGLIVLNSPGTVDNEYANEVGVIIMNMNDKPVSIANGDRIAQAVLCPVYYKQLVNLIKNEDTQSLHDKDGRNMNGFGSSGVK